ncbi:MAG: (Fe-S)-binding protein [Candidatus Bathyarchaeota archaeon]|nr:(Fe-S)-binding protein [Candidatus Bathyarchaeota archaeon]
MEYVYAPGCALTIYKPHLSEKMHQVLNEHLGEMARLDTCCRNHPELPKGTIVINTCPGCDRRYRNNYTDSTTKSVWEVIAEGDWFPFPDYHGARMSIHDACPTRDQIRVHKAMRTLLKRMNIEVVEPAKTGTSATCCGDSLYPALPVSEVNDAMRRRAAEMPVEDVVVYCVSCVKSMFIGGKKPRYMVDLLFGEETVPQTTDTVEWHIQVDEFTRTH